MAQHGKGKKVAAATFFVLKIPRYVVCARVFEPAFAGGCPLKTLVLALAYHLSLELGLPF